MIVMIARIAIRKKRLLSTAPLCGIHREVVKGILVLVVALRLLSAGIPSAGSAPSYCCGLAGMQRKVPPHKFFNGHLGPQS